MLRSRPDDLHLGALSLINYPGLNMPTSAQDRAMKQNAAARAVTFNIMISDRDSSSADSSSGQEERAVTSKISAGDDESPTNQIKGRDAFVFDKKTGTSLLTPRQPDPAEHTVAPIIQRLHSKEGMRDSPRRVQKNSLGNRAITNFRDEDLLDDLKSNIKPYQNRLLLLLHAASCKADSNHTCRIPHECAAFKQVLRHVLCCHKDDCSFPECKVSKILLNHFHRCSLKHCRLCTTLRNALQKSPCASPTRGSLPPLFPTPTRTGHGHDRHTPSSPRAPSQERYQRLATICRQQEEKIKKLEAINKALLQEMFLRSNTQAECSKVATNANGASAGAESSAKGGAERASDGQVKPSTAAGVDDKYDRMSKSKNSQQQEKEGDRKPEKTDCSNNKGFTFPVDNTKRALTITVVPPTPNDSTSSSSQGYKRAGSDEETSLPMKKRFRQLVGVEA